MACNNVLYNLFFVGLMCGNFVCAQQPLKSPVAPSVQKKGKPSVQPVKAPTTNIVVQKLIATLRSIQSSMRQTAAKGRARRAEESIRDKQIASVMLIVPLLAKNPVFLRSLERFGINKATVDRWIKQIQVTQFKDLMGSMGWAPRAWLGIGGGVAFMLRGLAMPLFLGQVRAQKESFMR